MKLKKSSNGIDLSRIDARIQIAVVLTYKALSVFIALLLDKPVLLVAFGIIDIGLIAFAVYCLSECRKRRMIPPSLRHSHATINGLEDGIAILIDILKETEISLRFVKGRTDDLLAVLQILREGPQAYKDKPTRIIRRSRIIE